MQNRTYALIPLEAHPQDELIELYSMGRLSEQDGATLEEHLLLCPQCRALLDESDMWTAVMKAALNQDAASAPTFDGVLSMHMAWPAAGSESFADQKGTEIRSSPRGPITSAVADTRNVGSG